MSGSPITGRAGVGYTLIGGRHVNDVILAPTNNVLNVLASLRYRFVEVGLDIYNLLGLKYADDEDVLRFQLESEPGPEPGVARRAHHSRAAADHPRHRGTHF